MSELKVYLPASLSEKFRRIAMSVYGYGRGSLSKAAEDAFSKWCEQHEENADTDVRETVEPNTRASGTQASHNPDERRPDPPKPEVASEKVEKSPS